MKEDKNRSLIAPLLCPNIKKNKNILLSLTFQPDKEMSRDSAPIQPDEGKKRLQRGKKNAIKVHTPRQHAGMFPFPRFLIRRNRVR